MSSLASPPAKVSSAPAGHQTAKVLVLGLGNDLLSDDAVGLLLARAASPILADCQNISVNESLEMGLSLLDLIVGFEALLLVDSIQTRHAPAGFLHELDLDDLKVLPSDSPHFLGIGEIIALGRKLDLKVPNQVRVLAVEAEDLFTVRQQLSTALADRMPELLLQVVNHARTLASHYSSPEAN